MIECMKTQTKPAEPVRCKDCKYNPYKPRLWYDDDVVGFYGWCYVFLDEFHGEGFCPFGKLRGEQDG